MDIVIHWRVSKGTSNSKNAVKGRSSSKEYVGSRSLALNTRITLTGLKNRIDLDWKQEVERRINKQFRRDIGCDVRVDGRLFAGQSARSAKEFSNNLANCILMDRNQFKFRQQIMDGESSKV